MNAPKKQQDVTVYRDHQSGVGYSYQVYIDGEAMGSYLESDEELQQIVGPDFDFEADVVQGLSY